MPQAATVVDLETYRLRQQARRAPARRTSHGMKLTPVMWVPVWVVWLPMAPVV